MAITQTISPGVTVTWARDAPAARRRTVRRSGPVTVRQVPVRDPMPSDEDLELVRRGGRHEHLAALLLGTIDAGSPPEEVDLQGLARGLVARGMARDTVLLALIDVGHPDVVAVSAVWWGSLDDKRTLVRALLRRAGWSGERVHDALAAFGVPVWERSGVTDPLGGGRHV